MIRHRRVAAVLLGMLAAAATPLAAQDWSLKLEAEGSLFPAAPADPIQVHNGASLAIAPEWEYESGDRRHLFTFEGFLRLDAADPDRTHADLRVVSWEYAADHWELRTGLRRVFWGVTESQHLVDIINQTDMVESPDGEDKLGQPMVNLALVSDFGTFDAFAMPLFRERTYPGSRGRLRFQPRVGVGGQEFLDGIRSERIDLAARWSHSVGSWDLGLSHFYGTSRDPSFALSIVDSLAQLDPLYEVIHQTGLDAQVTTEAWLWKLESILRSGQGDAFGALTGGFEYTFFGALGVADLGVLLEYSWDSRGEAVLGAPPPGRAPEPGPLGFSLFQNDLFFGSRLALNDVGNTSLLAGGSLDLHNGSLLVSLELSRRVAENWTLEAEARAFSGTSPGEPLYSLRRDDYLRLAVARYF